MTRRVSLGSAEFGQLFTEVKRSWFRLETLQHYDVSGEQEQFDAFQAGKATMPYDPADAEWSTMVSGHIAAGRTLQRVHVVAEPLSPYVQYELTWGYRPALEAGEDIRVIPCAEGAWPNGLPEAHDFWLLDEALWLMAYDPDGRPLYADHITDQTRVKQHLSWRDVAITRSIPVDDYIAQTAQLRERISV
jgi:hypothetical protein